MISSFVPLGLGNHVLLSHIFRGEQENIHRKDQHLDIFHGVGCVVCHPTEEVEFAESMSLVAGIIFSP